jgi:arylsulfatase A-like enzyme
VPQGLPGVVTRRAQVSYLWSEWVDVEVTGPDVLFIVLDCVRARDFEGGPHPLPEIPNTRRFASEALVCDHAVSAASWTIPSHASMFTGLAPWKHGVFKSGAHRLGGEHQVLAEELSGRGYRTGLFSANPLLSGPQGLSRGFDAASCGSFVECFFRGTVARHRSASLHHSQRAVLERGWRLESRVAQSALTSLLRAMERYPILADSTDRALSRISDRIEGRDVPTLPATAPWIEPALIDWFRQAPPDRPLFTFVNLIDAHEPYVGVPSPIEDARQWLERVSYRQDVRRTIEDEPEWSPGKRAAMTAIYRDCIEILDHRIGTILESAKEFRNWDETLVVLTSDHGQAFDERQSLFHMFGTSDAIHRVPLVIKPPASHPDTPRYTQWLSTRRIFDIVLDSAPARNGSAGRANLADALDAVHEDVVMSLADVNIDDSTLENPDLLFGGALSRYVVALAPEMELTVNVETGEMGACDLDASRRSAPHEVDTTDSDAVRVVSAATRAAQRIRAALRVAPSQELTPEERLRSWGYV